ncbi:MAG: hypothetical protein RMJ43_11290 [Chloroherpetonaceae bacterium]|nr:hypothetical protein [Chthonomonadaceae bacterium]MDW8208413.1 hypothetical protein [Chloroherpetonaceae bacterium]
MKTTGTLWSIVLGALIGGILLTASSAAQAQFQTDEIPELSRDWTIRAGLFIFNSRAARDQEGAVTFAGSVERTVYTTPTYDVSIGVGYYGLGNVYSVPIMAHIIGHRESWRYGIGGGYAFGRRLDGRGSAGAAIGLLVGYQINRASRYPLNVDLRYNFISGANNELDGYSITLGVKF